MVICKTWCFQLSIFFGKHSGCNCSKTNASPEEFFKFTTKIPKSWVHAQIIVSLVFWAVGSTWKVQTTIRGSHSERASWPTTQALFTTMQARFKRKSDHIQTWAKRQYIMCCRHKVEACKKSLHERNLLLARINLFSSMRKSKIVYTSLRDGL